MKPGHMHRKVIAKEKSGFYDKAQLILDNQKSL